MILQDKGALYMTQTDVFCGIVEDRDATPEEKKINEINSGTYCFGKAVLLMLLKELGENAQNEYYLTDAVGIIWRDKEKTEYFGWKIQWK